VSDVRVIKHPAVADRLARIRDRETPVVAFRRLVEEIGTFLAYEATRDLQLEERRVQTPLEEASVQRLAMRPVVAPILRAGLGLLPGFLNCIDDVEIAHLGFYRNPKTLEPVPYYANMPHRLDEREVFVLDPMLATGNSGSAALALLESRGAVAITFVSVIAAPEGIAAVTEAHPHVRIVTAAIDEHLNSHGYIMPGLGDAGDRMFGSATSLPVAARNILTE
jgi:uracil phosphoribosyltransferase